MTDLDSDTLVTLNKMCKFLHIRNYSSLRKSALVSLITRHYATIRLQRWTRRVLSKGESCPISCESIKYPCFAFKTTNNVLIYYNLVELRNFLIKTGDFRDPSTRANYTDEQLLEMDSVYKYYYGLHPQTSKTEETGFKSVFKASKSTRFYEKIKEKEQEQLIFERLLDSICDDMIRFVNETNCDNLMMLETMYLYDYRIQFRRLVNRSKTHAEYVVNRNISNVNQVVAKETAFSKNQYNTCEYIVLCMYQLREEVYLGT